MKSFFASFFVRLNNIFYCVDIRVSPQKQKKKNNFCVGITFIFSFLFPSVKQENRQQQKMGFFLSVLCAWKQFVLCLFFFCFSAEIFLLNAAFLFSVFMRVKCLAALCHTHHGVRTNALFLVYKASFLFSNFVLSYFFICTYNTQFFCLVRFLLVCRILVAIQSASDGPLDTNFDWFDTKKKSEIFCNQKHSLILSFLFIVFECECRTTRN